MIEEHYKKNAQILKAQWIYELEETMKEIEDLIKKEFYTGIWGLLFNRIAAEVYNIFLSKDIKHKILRQFDLILEAAKDYNGNSEEIIQKYYEDYLANDPAWARCKRRHTKSAELKERIKKSFLLILQNTKDLLNSSGNSYDELLYNAYKTKEAAWKATFSLIDDTEDSLEFTVKHKMVKINRLIRKQTIRILRREIEIAREYYENKLNAIFN
ncbi:MAG: hypothetical protein ACTSRS_11905 [Candidatus Helarchaeota archaeon]